MSVIGDIVAVAKELRDLRSNFSNAKTEQRQRIAAYLASISDCLDGMYESLKKNEVPHKRCAEMMAYAELLPSALGDTIDPEKAKELSDRLRRSHEVEGLWYEFKAHPEAKAELQKIAEAAGVFSGLANSVRVGLNL